MKKIVASFAVSFLIIALLFVAVIYNNQIYNETMHTLVFDNSLQEGMDDGDIGVRLTMRGHDTNEDASWYYTMEGNSSDHYVGAIYEMTISNLTDNLIEDWSATVYFPNDLLLAEGWNGDFEVHQYVDEAENVFTFKNSKFVSEGLTLDYVPGQNVLLMPMHKNDYFRYKPNRTVMEVPISGSDSKELSQKTIGFITYTKNVTVDSVTQYCRGNIQYRLKKRITADPLFYICVSLLWIWIVSIIVLIVVRIKVAKMEKEKQVIEEMVRQFERDDLTNVYSRRAFFHYADELLGKSDKEYSIAIVDVDNYKMTNNKYGDSLCKAYLVYLANYLKEQFPDGLVGRYSRSRFSILYEVRNREVDPHIFIDEKMMERSPMPNQVLKVGIYRKAEQGVSIRRCCDRVGLALSKIHGIYGQNISYYEEAFENELISEHQIMEHVEEALQKQQFQVYYQPKNDVKTGKLVGAEALVRWIHPEYGFMHPGQFVSVFEETGFITKLDAYVFEKVCTDMKEWMDKGNLIVPVSINISRKDFNEQNWLENRISFVKQCGIDPSVLHLEITESLYAEDMDMINDKVKWVRQQGFKIELDDFGSGYSSLGILTKLQLDMLKLDRSFVGNMGEEGVVFESVIQLAHKLNLKTIAEGVENEQEFERVRSFGCDYVQGFYFSKPLSHDAFEEYVKQHS